MGIISSGKKTLQIEAEALLEQCNRLDESFERAVRIVLDGTGKLIVTGMGKSGIVGKKMAATFASTGTPSFFMHPGEAYHGDLGMIEKQDVILSLSFSGETDEVLKLIPFIKSNGNKLISITGKSESTLAKNSDVHLALHVSQEACPLSLAPTTSTTATMAMGDALAVALMEERNFQPEDFARFHPGGSLGRKLLTRVSMLMKSDKLPKVNEKSTIIEVLDSISSGRLGITMVFDNETLVGVITDGDLRRLLHTQKAASFSCCAKDFMTKSPKCINENNDLVFAFDFFAKYKISNAVVLDQENKVVGLLSIYDIQT
jgi:arabinose-5-phosphate isomerase